MMLFLERGAGHSRMAATRRADQAGPPSIAPLSARGAWLERGQWRNQRRLPKGLTCFSGRFRSSMIAANRGAILRADEQRKAPWSCRQNRILRWPCEAITCVSAPAHSHLSLKNFFASHGNAAQVTETDDGKAEP